MRLSTGVPRAITTVFALLALLTAATAFGAEWWVEAAEQTKDEFQAITDSVSQTADKLEKAGEQLESLEGWARDNLRGDELGEALGKVKEVREALASQSKPLRLFSDHAGKVNDAIGAVWEIKQLAEDASKRSGGEGAQALHVIAWLMQKYGDKVPIPLVSDAIQAYGQMTMGILDATDQIAAAIEQNRNQGMFGAGTYGGTDSPLYQALLAQYGRDLADTYTYAPGNVPYVYAPVGQDPGWCLVWDPDKNKWEKVGQSAATVEGIYRDRALVKGHTDPGLLAGLAGLNDAIQGHGASAGDVFSMWQRTSTPLLGALRDAFDAVNGRHDYELWSTLDDERGFKARYVYDSRFRAEMNGYVVELYQELKNRGVDTAGIEEWAQRNGVQLPSQPAQPAQPAQPPEQPQPPAQPGGQQPGGQGPPQPGTPGGPAVPAGPAVPGQVKLSIAFLVDCSGSMDGEKIVAAKQAVASSVQRTNDGQTEWAVLGFGSCNVWEEIGFTQDAQAVVAAANQLSTGGDTPLTFSMYKAISYVSQRAHGAMGRLIILCDGQDNCDERHSVTQPEAMAGLRTLTRTVTPAAAGQ